MSNAKQTDNIEKMDFKQLRKEVQLLRDEMDMWRRKYEDAIQNLDESNFGKSFTVSQNNMKAQIKINAEEISTKVSSDELDGKLVNYSTISQTAEAIQTAVVSVNNATDEKLKNYSTVEQTAEQITATVTSEYVTNLIGDDIVTEAKMEAAIEVSASIIRGEVSSEVESLWDELAYVETTADKIASRVQKNITAHFTSNVKPTNSNTNDNDKSMLCLYDGDYYYYDEYSNSWKIYPYQSGIYTAFEQTAYGFNLTGDVSIDGDLISGGTVTGVSVSTAANFWGDCVRLNSANNSFELVLGQTVLGRWGLSDVPSFGTTIAPTGGGRLTIGNTNSGSSGGNTYAVGSWDFTGAAISWGANAPTAIFG